MYINKSSSMLREDIIFIVILNRMKLKDAERKKESRMLEMKPTDADGLLSA